MKSSLSLQDETLISFDLMVVWEIMNRVGWIPIKHAGWPEL